MAVPEYTKNAVRRYQESKERLSLLLDKGTKDRIKDKYGNDYSVNAYVKRLIDNDLNNSIININTDPESTEEKEIELEPVQNVVEIEHKEPVKELDQMSALEQKIAEFKQNKPPF